MANQYSFFLSLFVMFEKIMLLLAWKNICWRASKKTSCIPVKLKNSMNFEQVSSCFCMRRNFCGAHCCKRFNDFLPTSAFCFHVRNCCFWIMQVSHKRLAICKAKKESIFTTGLSEKVASCTGRHNAGHENRYLHFLRWAWKSHRTLALSAEEPLRWARKNPCAVREQNSCNINVTSAIVHRNASLSQHAQRTF